MSVLNKPIIIATINSEIDEIIEIIIDKSILLNILKSNNNETQNVITILMINTIAVFFIKNKDKEYKIYKKYDSRAGKTGTERIPPFRKNVQKRRCTCRTVDCYYADIMEI